MKNINETILSVFFLGTCMSGFAQSKVISGDFNGDGKITVEDIAHLTNVALGKEKATELYVVDPFNGHEYVDLGILGDNGQPIYWATMNVGADSPEENGSYFQWASTVPVDMTKNSSSTYTVCLWWDNAPFQTTPSSELSDEDKTIWAKYLGSTTSHYKDSSASDEDALKTVLDTDDDAANVNWGGNWRIPTTSELESLINQCYWEITMDYNNTGAKGMIVYKAKAESDKGKFSCDNPTLYETYSLSDVHIFLPSAGKRQIDELYINDYPYYSAHYWSSSVSTYLPLYANQLEFNLYVQGKPACGDSQGARYLGYTVRAVCQ